jgi:asparagine synthetase B (glutamine-hydrolysing)
MESDLNCARLVAAHLNITCEEILLNPETVIKNVPLAVLLGETSRGTIIDPCAALIEVAKNLNGRGYRAVVLCDAADDLFGGFSFALRYYRGAQLSRYFKAEWDKGLPDGQ